jgi:hypothetical protein
VLAGESIHSLRIVKSALAQPKVSALKGASELSVRSHPESKICVAISREPLLVSNKIVARTAPNLTRPRSAMQTVYEIKSWFPLLRDGTKTPFVTPRKSTSRSRKARTSSSPMYAIRISSASSSQT